MWNCFCSRNELGIRSVGAFSCAWLYALRFGWNWQTWPILLIAGQYGSACCVIGVCDIQLPTITRPSEILQKPVRIQNQFKIFTEMMWFNFYWWENLDHSPRFTWVIFIYYQPCQLSVVATTVRFPAGAKILLFATGRKSSQPPLLWVLVAFFSRGVKRPKRGADHSHYKS